MRPLHIADLSWAKKNRFTKMARKADYTLVVQTHVPMALFIDGRRATKEEMNAYEAAGDETKKAMTKAGKKGYYLPRSDVIPQDLPLMGAAKA